MRASSCLHAILLATFCVVATGVRPASACSCAGGPTPCQAFASSPIVFVGEVLSVERTGNDFHMRLQVVRPLKGITSATADLWSDARTSCSVKLEEGARYVIYTSGSGGRMWIHACDYSRKLAPGEPEPELPPVPGRVYGRVTRYDIDRVREFRSLEPMPSVRVNLELPTGRVSAVTDQWGRFQFADVPPGRHPMSADAGQGMTGDGRGPLIVPPGEACIDTYMSLRPSGKVSGRVVTSDGTPAAGVYVRLLTDGPEASRLVEFVSRAKTTDREGRFTIDGLEPDSYVLAVNPDAKPTGRQPYPPGFFGGTDRASATRIAVGAGSAIELDRPFVLPAPLALRTFTVAVTCRDGSIPPGLMTRAMAANEKVFAEFDDTGDGPVRTLKLVRDQDYSLLVSIFIPKGAERPSNGERREEALAPIALTAGAPGRHIALVAPFTNCAER